MGNWFIQENMSKISSMDLHEFLFVPGYKIVGEPSGPLAWLEREKRTANKNLFDCFSCHFLPPNKPQDLK